MEKLLKISLIISILGIFSLIILSNYLTIKDLEIKDINQDLINKKIQIQGIIFEIKDYSDFQLIKIRNETEEIEIIVNNHLNLTENKIIRVIGTVKEYNSNFQINAEKIFIINTLK